MEDKLINSSFLRKLEGIKLNSNIMLNKGYSGGRKSKSKGSSVEFSDFREYIPGDDYRKIDWNAYGRFDKLFIKLFMEEREALVNIFMDTSKSMDFGQPKKSYIAKQIASAIGYISLSNLDRINIFTFKENTIGEMGYINGKNNVSKLVNYLDSLTFVNNKDLFEAVKRRPYKRGISVIISDLFSDNFYDAIKYLKYNNQHIIIVHLLNQDEVSPQYMGDLRLIDSETEEGKDISLNNTAISSYSKVFKKFIDNIKETSKRYGCTYTMVTNDIPIENIIFDNLRSAGILR